MPGEREVHNFARTSEWSDRPTKVVWSYSIVCFTLLESIRSMQDPVAPRVNVLQADGPGYAPFKMCQPYNSHKAMSHGARQFVCGSSLIRGIVISSMVGDRSATRVFQSPHITCTACCGMHPSISSMWLRATSSSTSRLRKLGAGGRYTFPTHTFSLPWPWIHTTCAYSFPKFRKIFIPFFTSMAIPPLFPLSLRYSKTWYPGISSFT